MVWLQSRLWRLQLLIYANGLGLWSIGMTTCIGCRTSGFLNKEVKLVGLLAFLNGSRSDLSASQPSWTAILEFAMLRFASSWWHACLLASWGFCLSSYKNVCAQMGQLIDHDCWAWPDLIVALQMFVHALWILFALMKSVRDLCTWNHVGMHAKPAVQARWLQLQVKICS